MPYATGETPEVGDYIKNQWEQPGTVTRVHFAQDEEERVCVRWDDGGLELLFSPASEYTLVSRRRSPAYFTFMGESVGLPFRTANQSSVIVSAHVRSQCPHHSVHYF
jgi:hypothetical protein